MFCSNCGKEIEEGSAFCSGCGKNVGTVQSAPSAVPAQNAVYVNQDRRGGLDAAGAPDEIRKKMTVVILYFLGAAILLVMILMMIMTKFKILAEVMDFSGISQGMFEKALVSHRQEF